MCLRLQVERLHRISLRDSRAAGWLPTQHTCLCACACCNTIITPLLCCLLLLHTDYVSDVANGGQVLMDERTFKLVKHSLSALGTVDENGYNDKQLQQLMHAQVVAKMQCGTGCFRCGGVCVWGGGLVMWWVALCGFSQVCEGVRQWVGTCVRQHTHYLSNTHTFSCFTAHAHASHGNMCTKPPYSINTLSAHTNTTPTGTRPMAPSPAPTSSHSVTTTQMPSWCTWVASSPPPAATASR